MPLIRRLGWTAALTMSLSACVATLQPGQVLVQQAQQALKSQTGCCQSLQQAKTAKLPVEPTTVAINTESDALEFTAADGQSHKAFIAMFELPAFEKTYAIQIQSNPTGAMADRAILLPVVRLYDAAMQPTRVLHQHDLRNRGEGVERTVFINPPNANERYLVIHGAPIDAKLSRTWSEVQVTTVMIGMAAIPIATGSDTKSTVRSSPVGSIRLSLPKQDP